jgi:hypothetical protein
VHWQLKRVLFAMACTGAILSPQTANACSIAKWYRDLPLEQKISRKGSPIFIGRVTKIGKQVTIVPEEVLLGKKKKQFIVGQGSGPDCMYPYKLGERIFFSGRSTIDTTINIDKGIPRELQAVIRKLRRRESLDPAPIGLE